ncbi:MAG: phosphoribosylamine--glycine ligase, partial [Bacteroidales bacterium]|nr:phosphoribosylamine--glycine ligase [Bacteroidales bacterium]
MESKKNTVLVVGGGGREHAIVSALAKSSKVGKIYCAPGNAGIAKEAECVAIGDKEIEKLLAFAKEKHVDMTIVGPEASLALGVVDLFERNGLDIFGPSKSAAEIECSKQFAKDLMQKYNVPTAEYKVFDDYNEAKLYLQNHGAPIVLKYDGLAAGKGVVVAETLDEANAALSMMLKDKKFGDGRVIFEEKLVGPEFSFMCMVSGEKVYPMPTAQDHKRAYEGDKGPNTGGMGAYSPVPFITSEDESFALEKIMKPVARALVNEGCPFKGILYGGLIKTPTGIKVIEFNARFGDPETEVVLPRCTSDIYDAFYNVIHGQDVKLTWTNQSAIGIVLAS